MPGEGMLCMGRIKRGDSTVHMDGWAPKKTAAASVEYRGHTAYENIGCDEFANEFTISLWLFESSQPFPHLLLRSHSSINVRSYDTPELQRTTGSCIIS